jgi:hypothetical protein
LLVACNLSVSISQPPISPDSALTVPLNHAFEAETFPVLSTEKFDALIDSVVESNFINSPFNLPTKN